LANRRGVIGLPPSRERPRSAKREAGFTLIEVVVAFVVLSLVLAVVFEIFSTGLARASELDERSRALVVAQSKLALAGLEEALKDGESQGESEDRRFHWTVAVKRVQEDRESMPTAPSAYSMYHIDVSVAWRGADTRDHTLSLSTLGVGPRV
jgi:general secretion pathway protein I